MKLMEILLIIALLGCFASALSADDLESTLESLSADAAEEYVNPAVSALGANLNSGLFNKAPAPVFAGWTLKFGVVLMGAFFTYVDETFDLTSSFRFTRSQAELLAETYQHHPFYAALVNKIMSQDFEVNISGPTIIGPAYDEVTGEHAIEVAFNEQDVTFSYANTEMTQTIPAHVFKLPFGGILNELPGLPLAVPQLTAGTLFGTNLVLRYFPAFVIDKIGTIEFLGMGIQHNPAVWFNRGLPVDVAASMFSQEMRLGKILKATSTIYGVNLSRTVGARLFSLTPYLGIFAESSTLKFSYDYPTGSTEPEIPESIKIAFDAEGKNTTRITAGLSFRLAFLNLNFDYNLARNPSINAGVMMNFSW